MQFESKYDAGDRVWIMRNNIACQVYISRIYITAFSNKSLNWWIEEYDIKNELKDEECLESKISSSKLFKTKRGLLKSL